MSDAFMQQATAIVRPCRARLRRRLRRGTAGRQEALALVLMGALTLGPAASAVELQPADGGAPFRLGWNAIEVTNAPARKLIQAPGAKSARALHLAIRLGSGANAVIAGLLDESRGTGKGYDLLRVDANGNGDLTDDLVIRTTATRAGTVTALETESFDMAVSYAGDAQRTLHVRLEMRGYPKPFSKEMSWSASCRVDQHMEGRVDIGARKKLLIGIYDTSLGAFAGNGCFNDYGVDRLRMDINGDGTLDAKEEDFPLSKVIAVDGTLWELRADDAARKLEIAPCTRPTGKLTVRFGLPATATIKAGALELISDNGCGFRYPGARAQSLVLPEGSYGIARAWLSLAAEAGATWGATFSLGKPTVVEHGKEAVLTLGAPFTVTPVIHSGELARGNDLCVGLRLVGAGGEEYEDIAPENTRMTPAVRIVGAEDVVVAESNMEYG